MSDLPASPPNDPKESESRYRTLFENSPVSIWEEDFSAVKTLFDRLRHEGVTDIVPYFNQHPETVRQCADLAKIIDVNRASLDLHGAASKEELLAGLANTFTPESFDTFREELACLWHGETEHQRDAVVKTLAGEPRNVTISFTVCPGHEETLGRVFVSLIDITKRKQGAEALVISERQYRTLAGVLPDNIIRYDHEGRVTYLNPALEKNLGIHASDRIGKRVREFHTDGSYEAYAQAIDTVLATGEILEFEFILPKSDPPHIHAIRMVAEHNERGEITGALAISHDITELKQKEKELLASEQQFRSLAENSPDNIVRYDHQCRLIYYNPMMAQSMPFDAEMALGKTPMELSFGGPEVSAEYEKHIRQVLQSGESSDMEITAPYAQGELRHNLVRFAAEHDTQGEVSGVLAIGRDITALKHAEQERQLHTDFLAKLDRINRAIQGAEDIETMMGNVLHEVLNIFECDRVYLLYPCDPSAESFSIPMERTRPEFPGMSTSSTKIPIDAEISNTQELLLHSSSALQFGPGT
ncbi:MAG: PAS domain-containing protein, partial [Candidatus Thiodiazotropha sp.]